MKNITPINPNQTPQEIATLDQPAKSCVFLCDHRFFYNHHMERGYLALF